jgi:histidine ammonia-lyase
MTVELNDREDFTLDNLRRVAWDGEPVAYTNACLRRLADARMSFEQLLASDENQFIYGVTTRYGLGAKKILDANGRRKMAKQPAFSRGSGVGEPYPDRVVRAMIFARLTNFVTGNAAITPCLAQAVADMLDGRALPTMRVGGQDASGESVNLAELYWHLMGEACEVKDNNAMANGSPCSAGLAGDSALRAGNRLRLCEQVFALSIDASGTAFDAFDKELQASAALDTCLALLAVFASQVLAVAKREPVPPVHGIRPVATEMGAVISLFDGAVLGGDFSFFE